MPASRRCVVISGAGDRRDQDLIQQTQILGEAFDEVILFEDQCQRGRSDGEVIALLRQGLTQASRTVQVKEIQGEFLAIDAGMDSLKEGELCLILVDQVDQAMAHIAAKIQSA
jgi:cyanophycin synthetase